MTEPTEAVAKTAHGAGNAFTRKMGPFPLWAWGLILGGLYVGYRALNSKQTTAQAAADPATTDGQLPDISTMTGSGPAGVGGYFVPIDSFGKGVNIPTTGPVPGSGPQYPGLAKWIAYRRAHPKPPLRYTTEHRTSVRGLSQQWLGSPIYWRLIHNQNLGVATPDDIPAGTTVLIPQH